MRTIKAMAEHIEEELEGAKDYAEKYVEAKARGNLPVATKYKEMASDELRHAGYIHEFAVAEIESVSKVFTPPAEMMEKWERLHREYVEKVAWIRQMIAM